MVVSAKLPGLFDITNFIWYWISYGRYCECFALGVYCVGSCACRDCFNKPEYIETVINTRQQIESRNPLAFAPKIVQGAEPSPVPGVSSNLAHFTLQFQDANLMHIHGLPSFARS